LEVFISLYKGILRPAVYQILNEGFYGLSYTKFLRMLIEVIPKMISRHSENNTFCLVQVFSSLTILKIISLLRVLKFKALFR